MSRKQTLTYTSLSPSPDASYFSITSPAVLDVAGPRHPDIQALQNRIHHRRAALKRLRPQSPDYTTKRFKIENEVQIMQDDLQALELEEDARLHADNMRFLENSGTKMVDGEGSKAPSTPAGPRTSRTTTVPTGFTPYASSGGQSFGDQFPSAERMAREGRTGTAESWMFPNLDMNSHEASASATSTVPSHHSTPCPDKSRKRDRGSSSSTNDHVAKSRRATPSPAVTGVTTPASPDSFDFEENSELSRLLGGDPKQHLREMREEQRREEEALRARREQELRDEEFARQLDEAENSPNTPSSGLQARPNQLSRAHSQTYFTPEGGIQRRRARTPTPPPSRSSHPSFLKHDYDSQNPVKFEYPTNKPIPFQQQNLPTFIDLEDDDDFVDLTGHSSSPLEGSSNPWPLDRPNASSARHIPWLKSESQIPTINGVNGFASGESAYAQQGSFTNGHIPQQSSSSWGNAASNVFQAGLNAAQNVYNAGYSMLDPLTTYSSTGYGPAGSSINPISFNDNDSGASNRDKLTYSGLNAHLIDIHDPQNEELINRYRDRVDYLTHDPTRTTEEIKSLLENIRPDEDLPKENREGTPDAMTYPLMEHQKLGLAWMRKMEEGSNKGGILADDMGLGKTIQALALMVSRRSQDPGRKTTLIVAPVALMKQWEREIRRMLKPERQHKLSTFIMHGQNRSASWEKLRTFDVVLTTFGTLATELKRKEGIDMAKRANPNWRPISKADQLPLLGDGCKWYRVIIDEAQCIKNKNTRAAVAASSLQTLTRFCMTGTPMMNNVGELYSLIRFLRIKPYDVSEVFNRDFKTPLKKGAGEGADKAMQMLQALLKAILLRRTKKSTIDGKPICTLPERTTEAQNADFSDDERAFYRALETQTQLQFNKYVKAGTVGRNYSNVLVLLLRLRQACCHPHLIKDFGVSSGTSDLTLEEMIQVAKELDPAVVAQIQERTGSGDLNGLECPICMDMSEDASIIIPCGHSTCSECFARITDPSQAIANGDADANTNGIKCPECRGKIDLRKVVTHQAFKKAHMPGLAVDDLITGAAEQDEDDEDDEETDDESEEGDMDSDESGSLKDFVVDDDVVDEETTDDSDGEAEGYRKGKTPFEKSAKQKKRKAKGKGKGKAKSAEKPPRKTLAELKKEGARNAKARKRYLNRLRKEYVPSAKIEKTMEILRAVQQNKDGEKTIIFSQFTSLLDLLELPIADEGWGYKRYDGSMNPKSRNEAVLDFTDKEDCKIMLVSLKAGNSGLNLVAASQVIIFDPFWNPYIEEQAIDRAHRIGQLRPVKVHRILVPDTVEDRILKLQEQKRLLIEGALDEKASQNIGRLGIRELAYLFGVSHR